VPDSAPGGGEDGVRDGGRGWLGDRMITKGDLDPRHYAEAVARIAPEIDVRLVLPGTTVTVP
jgi:hypothetical protein